MENTKTKIEVYGIPLSVGRCYACQAVTKFLDERELPYDFHQVLYSNPEGLSYDRPLIQKLADRLGQKSLSIAYPVVFVNNSRAKTLKDLKIALMNLGYSEDFVDFY